MEGKGCEMKKKPEIIFRVFAFLLTLMATILLGVAKQTKHVTLSTSPNLPPVTVAIVSKPSYFSALKYFVAVNGIACSYGVLSMLVLIRNRHIKTTTMSLIIIILDISMVALLFSGIGAAGAFSILALEGNSHLKWNKVCNVFERFCHQAMAALVVSLVGSLSFILLVVFATRNLLRPE